MSSNMVTPENSGAGLRLPYGTAFQQGGYSGITADTEVPPPMLDYGFQNLALGENNTNGFQGAQGNAFPLTGGMDPADAGGWANTLSGYGSILKGVSGVAEAYTGYRNYQLGREQFKFGKQAFNRNMANQAVVTNERLASQRRAREAFSGRGAAGPLVQVNGSSIG